jgi:hypothetical protein
LFGDFFDLLVGLGDDFLFSSGMTMSTIPMEVPERVASLKPRVLRSSSTFDGLLLAGDLIAAPDDVADLLLADVVVDETDALGPDFVEADAAGVVSMILPWRSAASSG